MEAETIIIMWSILGLINLSILYIIAKQDPKSVYLGHGFLYEVGLLFVWFSFAFIIIPYFLFQYVRKLTIHKLTIFEKKLREELKKK